MSDGQSLYHIFRDHMKSFGYDTSPVSINGHFVSFLDPDVDNMWLGFCLAKGGEDLMRRAIHRGTTEGMEELIKEAL